MQLRHPRGEPIALCKMLVDVSSLPNVTVPTLPTFDASEPSVEPSVEQPTLASKLLRRASLGKVMGKSKPDLLKAPSASPVGRIFDRKRSTFGNLRLSGGSRASLRRSVDEQPRASRGSRGSVSGGRPSVINSDGEGSNSRGSVSGLGSDADAGSLAVAEVDCDSRAPPGADRRGHRPGARRVVEPLVVFFGSRLDERGLGRPRERRPRCRRRVALAAVRGFLHGRRRPTPRLALFRHVGAGLGGVAGQLH